jgi:muramoyltetrapeptide carboxypeptidase
VTRPEAPRLRRADTVGIVSPGFAVKRSLLQAGVARLQRMGYRTRLGRHVLARNGYLAGTDAERASDLESMLRDPEVRAIWFSRGGYGSPRLLEAISWRRFTRDPKLLIGYSDLTALFSEAVNRAGPVCLYGPVVAELGQEELYHAPSLRRQLAGGESSIRFRRRQVLMPGRARGPLIGGNLSVLSHLCGTRFAPRARGAILFLEEVGEEAYRIDRMLTQLRLAGLMRHVAGVLLGSFVVPRRRRFPPDRALPEILREFFLPLGVPVVCDLPAGHLRAKRTLPLGAVAEIDTGAGRVRLRV